VSHCFFVSRSLIDERFPPVTVDMLVDELLKCGVRPDMTLLVHTRMSSLGWICGGEEAVVLALLKVLGAKGTLMMPSFSSNNSDPANWTNPPVPAAWWQRIRDSSPPFDPVRTPSSNVGRVAELFRTFPGVKRSLHPFCSFSAIGPNADFLLNKEQSIECVFGDASPIGKLYQLDGHILMLGSDFLSCTSLHLSEYRANIPRKFISDGTAVLTSEGKRRWVEIKVLALNEDEFVKIGEQFEMANALSPSQIGKATVRLLRQRALVDFGVQWLEKHHAT
jgi:aminoglycoside 3-N-acetyltransferase